MVALLRPTLVGLLVLAGCSAAERPEDAAVSQARGAPPKAQLAYRYSYQFRLPSNRLAEVQRRHVAMCERLGPRCRLLETHGGGDGARTGGSTRLDVASGIAQRFGDTLVTPVRALGGSLVSSDVAAEDLSRQIVDIGARVRAKEVLATRLTRMLETRAGSTADLVATEKAVAEVREQLDAARTALAQAQGRIATSPVEIGYDGAPTLAGETGAAFDAVDEVFAASVAALIYVFAAAVPWLAILGGLAFGGRKLLRRIRRRR